MKQLVIDYFHNLICTIVFVVSLSCFTFLLQVYNSLQNWYSGYFVGAFNVEEPPPPCEDPDKEIFYNGNYYVPVSSDSEGDTYNKLKVSSLVLYRI